MDGAPPGEQAALQWSEVDLKSTCPVVEVRATLDPRKSGSRRAPKTRESAKVVELVPQAVAALKVQLSRRQLACPWVFPAPDGGPLNICNLTRRVYYPAVRRAELIERPLYIFGILSLCLCWKHSDGDLQMLQYTAAGSGARFMMIVHHTDAEREFAYDRSLQSDGWIMRSTRRTRSVGRS